jgi:hypothetical protein
VRIEPQETRRRHGSNLMSVRPTSGRCP